MHNEPYWNFHDAGEKGFLIESIDGVHRCLVPREGGTSPEYPQQRSIGHFLKWVTFFDKVSNYIEME